MLFWGDGRVLGAFSLGCCFGMLVGVAIGGAGDGGRILAMLTAVCSGGAVCCALRGCCWMLVWNHPPVFFPLSGDSAGAFLRDCRQIARDMQFGLLLQVLF